MSAVGPTIKIAQSAPVPRLLVDLPSWPGLFIENLRDLLLPRQLPPLALRSAPAPFWNDVFVSLPLPWNSFLQSALYHIAAGAALIALAHLLSLQPKVVSTPTFDRSQVIYYQPSEYLPPLDTRDSSADRPAKADPEFSPQPIISVPRESDNRSQTIVTPPNVKIAHNMALPNAVAWSDTVQKPRLEIPPAPLTPAADITRIAPKLENQAVAPPQDPTQSAHRRNSPTLQDPVVAPPTDIRSSSATSGIPGLQPQLVAPPTSLDSVPVRTLGNLNIAPSNVIAPAPALPVAAQRTTPGGRTASLGAPQIALPPPTLSASGSGVAAGSTGRMIALSLHPGVSAPPNPPEGNRRGAFAAAPEGHASASGTPGTASGSAGSGANSGTVGGRNSGASGAKGSSDLPSGLYVGAAAKPSSPVAGEPTGKTASNTVNPNLVASVHPPRVTTARPMQPDTTAKLSEPERAVFGNRHFYSVTLNMPNLNSGGGSWVIRFAELNHPSSIQAQDPSAPASDISQPMATRKVDPAYPMQLMRENVHGTVILYAVIHADGTVGSIRVLRGVDDRLDRFASDALAQWKFEPATKEGAPVDVEATFQIPFRPAHVGSNF